MTISSLRARLERQGRVRDINPVRSGSPAAFALSIAPGMTPKTVSVALELHRRGIPLLRAKRAMDEMLANGRGYVELPVVEDVAVVCELLGSLGVTAAPLRRAESVDPRAVREALGLTQEQFALRFGLELDTLQNWETGRREPDTAAKSYLRVIAREPARVQAALVGD